MGLVLIILLISLPILEIVVLIKIGGAIGFLYLLTLLVTMAIIGGWLLRRQGLSAARRALAQMERNEAPVQSMVDGIGLTLAGILMLIPGLITDVLGLLLLIPFIRRPLVGRLLGGTGLRWQSRRASAPNPSTGSQRSGPDPASADPAGSGQTPRDGVVIEGEFERVEERTIRPGQARGG